MQEIVRVAKEERLITICTIHQPSTKVYNNFDQVMIMSRGRTAFMGDVQDAIPYFTEIGHPMPDDTNPAEVRVVLVLVSVVGIVCDKEAKIRDSHPCVFLSWYRLVLFGFGQLGLFRRSRSLQNSRHVGRKGTRLGVLASFVAWQKGICGRR